MSEITPAANTGTEPTAETRDLIDQLIDALNDGVEGITFDRDVLDTNRPEDWGAVEMTGQAGAEYADGRMIDQIVKCDLWVCTSDRGASVRDDVQKTLIQFNQDHDIAFRFDARNYLYDLDKVMYKWVVHLWGPVTDALWPGDGADEADEAEEPEEPGEDETDEDFDPENPGGDPVSGEPAGGGD